MKALNFLIIKLTFCLIAGILFSHFFCITLLQTFVFTVGLLIILWILNRIAGRSFHKTIWFGLVAFVLMFTLGILTHNTHHQKNFLKHYTNSHKFINSTNLITFRIKERLKPTIYHQKYIVELIKINEEFVSGKVLLNIEKQNNSLAYNVDDMLSLQSKFEDIKDPLNPSQFNYKAYLEKQYIYHQLYTEKQSIFEVNLQRNTIFGYADALRQTINKRLRQFNFKRNELDIINALILGQRQDMEQEMYLEYANAGAIHILAVSGLHVGIILMMLNVVLKPIEYIRQGKAIKVIMILMLLWSFAVVAGLSASVTRAVTMFSIVAIAMHLKRPTNIYNTLSISMFILLLFKPMFLFDVGFQMSYLAVFAIVTIQPLLQKLWLPQWKIVDYFWQIFTVTIAAQLGVVPISLFYFHQFPGLFIISNLAIIPFLGLILGFGILVILLSLLNVLPEPLANAYGSLIKLMNHLVSWVSRQEEFLIKDISFNLYYVISTYLLLLALILVYKRFHYKRIVFLLVSILILQGTVILTKYKNQTDAFIVFHKSRYSVFGRKRNTDLTIWHNLDSSRIKNDKMISNFKIGNFIKSIRYDTIYNVYSTSSKKLLIVDSLGVYEVGFKPNYILLRDSPKINLKRVIDSLEPELIIADGSNYKSYVQRWKATCLKEKLPFHVTYKKGALVLK